MKNDDLRKPLGERFMPEKRPEYDIRGAAWRGILLTKDHFQKWGKNKKKVYKVIKVSDNQL
jgi:hypothetical protein